jgi:hypothetical protein
VTKNSEVTGGEEFCHSSMTICPLDSKNRPKSPEIQALAGE